MKSDFKRWIKFSFTTFLYLVITLSTLKGEGAKVKRDSLHSYLSFLASDSLQGRFPGTIYDSIAAYYIAEKMAESGLEPLIGNSYLIPFNFIIGREVSSKSSFSLNGKRLKEGVDYTFSPLSPNKSIVGVVNGDRKDREEGSTVLLLKMEYDSLKYVVTEQMERGYSAIINWDPNQTFKKEERARGSLFPIPVISITRSIYNRVLESPNCQVIIESVTTPIEVKSYNVAGVTSGTGEKTLLVGAHYDHLGVKNGELGAKEKPEIFYGADDNGSGIASLLEIIRVLNSDKKTINSTKWRKVYVAFGAEEQGVVGSSKLVDSLAALGKLPTLMFNIDMVGRLRERQLYVEGVGTFKEAQPLLDSVNSLSNQFQIKGIKKGSGGSDHSSFNIKKVPVLSFSTGPHSEYHSPADSVGTINFKGLQTVTSFVVNLIQSVEDGAVDPIYIEQQDAAPRSHLATTGGRKVTIGVIPDFTYEEGFGFKIASVIEGKSAQQAGLQGGDIIIEIGENRIANVYDYMGSLAKLKSGESVKIKFIREGEERESTVTPE